ncbi:MAG: glycosyltransferase [Marinagarivorans sp.]|nr:glycosyltransferase [Marinagarivorans sp.]
MLESKSARRYRIAILIDSLRGGGAEKVMLTLAKTLIELGHYPHIISMNNDVAYDIDSCIPVTFLYQDKGVKLSGRKKLKTHTEKLKNILAELESASGAFDLYLSNLFETGRIVSSCHLSPCYHVVHNSVEKTLKRAISLGPVKYFYLRYLINFLNGKNLICVSRGVAAEIERVGRIKPASIGAIYNPFDLNDIKALASVAEPDLPNEPYLIHVGRIARQKQFDVLFEALKHLTNPIKLVCLCDNLKKAKRLAIKHGVLARVIFPGFQKNPYPWIKNAKALVLSSSYEGFGNVLVEALACNTVPVSTDCNYGPGEILTGELSELLSPVGDPVALAHNTAKALANTYNLDAPILKEIDAIKIAKQYLSLIKH